jgi:hypothetical protein
MKIWFDISNSPHINMFAHMIAELKKHHEVVVTCRPLANTIDLLKLHAIEHTVVGKHYGAGFLNKLLGFPVRVLQLVLFLRKQKVDVSVSQSSFHSPVVSRLLGIDSIYMNDNEHAMGNIPAFICANKIMVPEFLSLEKLKKQHASAEKLIFYPGVKEGIYLWELQKRLGDIDEAKKTVFVRLEPWTAQYYKGEKFFLDNVLVELAEQVDVVLLPRGKEQAQHYKNEKFSKIKVVTGAIDLALIAPSCSLFIGAGGTMTREMAVLGVPTISVYQDQLLDVDGYLLSIGAFVHMPNLTAKDALDYLHNCARLPPNTELLEKGQSAFNLIVSELLKNK